MEERNVTVDDILHVLRTGWVASSVWNEKHQNCEYEIKGTDCDHMPLAVVVAPQPSLCRLTVITVKDAS